MLVYDIHVPLLWFLVLVCSFHSYISNYPSSCLLPYFKYPSLEWYDNEQNTRQHHHYPKRKLTLLAPPWLDACEWKHVWCVATRPRWLCDLSYIALLVWCVATRPRWLCDLSYIALLRLPIDLYSSVLNSRVLLNIGHKSSLTQFIEHITLWNLLVDTNWVDKLANGDIRCPSEGV